MAPHPVSGPNPTNMKKTSKITHLHPQDGHPAFQVCARHTARKNQSLLMRQISRFQVVPMLHKLRHWNTDIHLDPEVLTIGSIVRTALHHQNHLKSIHSMCKVKPALSMSPTRLCQNSACINFVFTATTLHWTASSAFGVSHLGSPAGCESGISARSSSWQSVWDVGHRQI